MNFLKTFWRQSASYLQNIYPPRQSQKLVWMEEDHKTDYSPITIPIANTSINSHYPDFKVKTLDKHIWENEVNRWHQA